MSTTTQKIMARVARYERRRVRVALVAVGSLSVVVASTLVVLLLRAWGYSQAHQTFSPLVLMFEHWELALEYWQDGLSVAWQELPYHEVITLGLVGVLVSCLWLLSGTWRSRLRQTVTALRAYDRFSRS